MAHANMDRASKLALNIEAPAPSGFGIQDCSIDAKAQAIAQADDAGLLTAPVVSVKGTAGATPGTQTGIPDGSREKSVFLGVHQ